GAVLDRLRADAFVLVTGDSGVGKSSLCRAGVLPQVAERGLGPSRTWTSVTVVPGKDLIGALASALASRLGTSDEALARKLRSEPAALARGLRRHLGDANGLIVFIDQLEEIATVGRAADLGVAEEVLTRLAAGAPGLRLLATARA